MSVSLNGSSQYLSLGSAPVAATPLSIAIWMKPVDHVGTQAGVSLEDGLTNTFLLQVRGVTNNCAAGAYQSGWGLAYTTADYADGTWQHLCGVYTSNILRAVYLDGANKGTDSTNQTPASIDEFLVGIRNLGTPTGHYEGKIAHVAVWDIALSDAEVAQLAGGANPLSIQAGNLVAYWPLHDSGWSSIGAISELISYGSPSYDSADNPTVTEVKPDSVAITGRVSIFEGYTLILNAVPSGGSENFTYQWNKDASPISGATSATYTKVNVVSADAGSYTCTVTNGGGSTVSSAAVVTVGSSSIAFVMGGPRSASNKSVWGYNGSGALLWSYDTGGLVYGVKFDPSGIILVWGVAADNGDGGGTRTIWRLNPDGSYIDGANIGTEVVGLSNGSSGVIVTIGGTNDLYVLDGEDFSVISQDSTIVDGGYACLYDTGGNIWYGYQDNQAGPDYFYLRKLDPYMAEVFNVSLLTADNERILGLKEASTGKVISWHPSTATVRRHAIGGGGGFQGEYQTAMPGWGSVVSYQSSLFVDQSDSDKIYVVASDFGVLSYAGAVLYNKSKPSRERLTALGECCNDAGKVLVLSAKGDGGNLYLWEEAVGELVCVQDLDGPDDEVNTYGLDTTPATITWSFPVTEELDSHDTDNQIDSISASVWVAQTFTLADYKKAGRVSLHVSRAGTTGTVTASIQAVDGSGKPDGVDICTGTFTAIDAGADTTRYLSHIFFTTTPVLAPGTYAIVVRASDGMSIGVDSGGGHSGDFWDSVDSGSSWAAGSYSLTFDLWGDESGYVLPSFDAQSSGQTLYVGQTPTPLSVIVSGTPTPTYQWYADGSPISGATSSSYSPPAQSVAKSISYVCRATNALGSVDSNPMVIVWQDLPVPSDPTRYNILNMQLDMGTRV